MVIQQSVLFHLSQFFGQGAPVKAEIVSKLLTVQGNIDIAAALSFGLMGKIREQAATDLLGGCVENTAGEQQVFACTDHGKIADQHRVFSFTGRGKLE